MTERNLPFFKKLLHRVRKGRRLSYKQQKQQGEKKCNLKRRDEKPDNVILTVLSVRVFLCLNQYDLEEKENRH